MRLSDFAVQLAEDLAPEDLRLVLGVFGQDVDRLTRALEGHARDGDADGFRRACHSLAGAAGAVGATALERACREAMTSPGLSRADLAGALADIRRRSAAARIEMDVFLAALPPD
jgi:HPt (histidine-containing phosphotransfer) domain-containing protein